jgi:hypothetical protein
MGQQEHEQEQQLTIGIRSDSKSKLKSFYGMSGI